MRKRLLNLCLTALFSVVSTAAWALSDVNGVYQIGSAADLEEFAVLVNDGNVYACAELTADIDRGMDGTMIGVWNNSVAYQGTFDGKGHTIKINMYPEVDGAALFQYTGFGAVIQNLKVTGTITTSKKFAAGLVARNSGIIRGCYIDVTINSSVPGDATHGGIVGVGYGGCTVEDCLAKISIKGETTTNCGGVVGWAEKRINVANCLVVSDGSTFAYTDASNGHSSNLSRNEGSMAAIDVETYNANPYANRPKGACYNNYVTVDWGGTSPATTVVAYDDLADGRICYQLNNDQSHIAWVQRIGTDPFPVPAAFGEGQVFASDATDCDGKSVNELTFSNEGGDQATKHMFDKYGVCSACGCFDFHGFEFDDPSKFDQKDRAVLLVSAEDIDKVEGWNRIAQGFRLNMKMMNDIEYIAEPGKYIFNPSDWIDGNFNGGGHVLTIGMSDMGDKAALFPEMDGNVENLILKGSITTSGARSGSVSGNARMALVRNVFSDVDITSSRVGDNTSGGFFGWMGDVERTVENCIYAGTFTLPGESGGAHCARVGGFSGWAASKTYFKNCAILGNIVGAGNQTYDDDTENSQNISRNPGNVVTENVYVVNPIFGNAVSDHDKYSHYENEEGIANGELAFFLNGRQNGLDRFYQEIGVDPEPMPIKKEGALVYTSAGKFKCDGTPIGEGFSYTNNASGGAVIPPHDFQDGWCVNCGKFDETFMTPVDGWFVVSDGAEFAWWTNYANMHKDVCARLTDDIDMGDYMEKFVPVEMYVGEFDGKGHMFSNFVLETTKDYQGLFGTIADGANIHDFVLDETCSISGNAFCGIIGGTSGGGKIYITNVGNEGEVFTTNQNAAGIVGVDQGGAMDMFITNCWVTGAIYGGRESGAICGYSSGGSKVVNCWSTAFLPQSAIYSSDSFTRGGATTVNCYEAEIEGVDPNKQQHNKPMADNRKASLTTLEEVENGALCYKLNGKQFSNPTWYQTLEEDVRPYPYSEHGIVIFAADQYFSIPNSDLDDVLSAVKDAEEEALEEIIATQSLIDDLEGAINALDEVETIEGFIEAAGVIDAAKQVVKESADAYTAYIAKCEEVKDHLATHDDFEGSVRTALEDYLSDEAGEPSDDNPLGTYAYIIENHTAATEDIKAETERVTKWLAEAISSGYVAGTDVSSMIPNYDFSKQNESWTGGFGNSWGQTQNEANKTFVGVEAWKATGDMYQTVEGMKPGYYLVGINAAFRPSNNRYSTNYAAGIYANGIFNYFPTVIEDPVAVEDAEDGVNCNLEGAGSPDFAIYDDGFSTDGDFGIVGYVVRGETGMAIAAKANRYQAYTIAQVGEDGKLTIGIKNPGTNYGDDWTGWSALKVTYCGEGAETASPALDVVLENMKARALTIGAYVCNDVDEPAEPAPNFPAALKSALEEAVAQIEAAESVEDKVALAAKFSEIFEGIYEGKQAYVKLFNLYNFLNRIPGEVNLPLVEKDDETGAWFETGENVFDDEELIDIYDFADPLIIAYEEGSYSVEDIQNAIAATPEFIPSQDEDGYYLIGTTRQFVVYRFIASEVDKYAKGKLTADVDMAGIAMLPIGHNRGENAQHIFAGVFDGQGHALTNVYIDDENIPSGEYSEPATLFYELQNATVKNLKLTGDYHTTHQNMGGVTRYMSGNSLIDNCEIALVMRSGINGDGTHGGVVGYCGSSSAVVSNCIVNNLMMSDEGVVTLHVGGVCGWGGQTLTIKNTLILSQYENIGLVEAGDVNSNSVCRNSCSVENVYISSVFREQKGTLVTAEELASGDITWKLNGKTSENPVWFQTLGVDATPRLFDGATVYLYAGQYTNEKPNIQLNAFAYNLEANKVGNNVVVNYDLNAEAEGVEIQFFDGDELVYTAVANDVPTAGTHKVTVPVSAIGTADNFKVSVTGKGSLEVSKIGESYNVWGPYGMAINNNPASKNFGQVLLAESWVQDYVNGDKVYHTGDKVGALYAFDADFQPINAADGTPGFYGGLDIATETPLEVVNGYCLDLTDLRFTEDGRLFVARSGAASNSSVWEINPENLDEPWKPVFTGGELDEQTGITYVGDDEQNRMAISLAFEGKGDDLKMYVLGGQRSNGEVNTTDYNCAFYNLGTATEWAAAASGYVDALDGVFTSTPYQAGIYADGQGGLWFLQRATATAETPAIKHFDAEGKEDYSNTSSQYGGGRMTVTADGNYLAIPTGTNTIVLYETNYVPMENGKIFLNPKQTIKVSESSIGSLAFDYANNLYVASGGTETFSRYTIPGMNKVVVTPGNGIGTSTSITGDLNGDGKVDIADAVSVLNIMAAGEYNEAADLNGDQKIDIADFVSVLNIMAAQ